MHKQFFGFVQGCPPSPFLFSIVMTTFTHDASSNVEWPHPPEAQHEDWIGINELIYADDALIVSVTAANAEAYMKCISAAGANYGLAFNWKNWKCSLCAARRRSRNQTGQVSRKQIISYIWEDC